MKLKVATVWMVGASLVAAIACSGSDESDDAPATGGKGGASGSSAGGVSSGGKSSGGSSSGSAGEQTTAGGMNGGGGTPSAGAGGVSGAPALAQAIVYYSGALTAREIWIMDPDGMNARALTSNSSAEVDPQLSPDGTKIVFERVIGGSSDIWVMNADGSNELNLTPNCAEDDAQPSWSPDAEFIAYVSACDDPTYTKLYRVPADGSSDGGLWVVATGGAGGGPSASDDSNSRHPDWNAEYVAYDSDRSGNLDIWVKFVDDVSAGVNLTLSNTTTDGKPAFSPDGGKIAFTSHRDGIDGEICVMNANGTGFVQLTANDFADTEAQWSPDGTKIAFASDRDGSDDIWVMDADGGNLIKLTPDTDASNEHAPHWGYYSP